MDPLAELTAMEANTAAPTVMVPVPLILPCVAVTIAEPLDFAVARPLLEIDAIAELEILQVAELLRFWVLPSL